MKRTAHILAGTILAGALVSLAGAQSEPLGDFARAERKENKPAASKVYDNDNLPTNTKLSVVGKTDDDQTTANGAPSDGQTAAQAPDGASDKKKEADALKSKLSDQQGKVDLLARELDVAQREYRLRAAAMYGDVGNRLRNAGAWDKEDADYKKKIADKQKAVDDAKKALGDLQEQARKAGTSQQ